MQRHATLTRWDAAAQQNPPDDAPANFPNDLGCCMSFVIAAPASGSGKTTVTLGLLRALTQEGLAIRGAKSGPDYIDPRFHAAACGATCLNLDAWAMTADRIKALAAGPPLIVEGAMGLFDGAPPDGKGSSADIAKILDIPVVLVIDASRMAQSVAAVVGGFIAHDPALKIAGVILNRVGSPRHEDMLRTALSPLSVPVLGALPRDGKIAHPSRHLGLVQADEHTDLNRFLETAAQLIKAHINLSDLPDLTPIPPTEATRCVPPPAQRIAIAQDAAFAFAYPHLLADWQGAGATVLPFSPLANDLVPDSDFVFLPGGYPELYAGQLAANADFLTSLRAAAPNRPVYGECGGYMVLGDALVDADGTPHRMAGLLRLETSFANRKLHLGYRTVTADSGPFKGQWNAHEFHYATTRTAEGTPLFSATDATGASVGPMGLRQDNVSGSFAHIIEKC